MALISNNSCVAAPFAKINEPCQTTKLATLATATVSQQAWRIYRLHWDPQKQQRLRRERHLAAYKRYCDECWDVRRDVRTASHLVEALTWLSRFCLMSQGHDGWDVDMRWRRQRYSTYVDDPRRRTFTALVALPPLQRRRRPTMPRVWSGQAKDVLWKQRFLWHFPP